VLKELTKKVIMGYYYLQKIGRFLVPKTMLSTFSHPFYCCMGLIGVKSIIFSRNTLLTTSFEDFDLKETSNGIINYANIQQIGKFLVQKQLF
jgi:hypothetical protein